jgi:hypothetical protein
MVSNKKNFEQKVIAFIGGAVTAYIVITKVKIIKDIVLLRKE